MSRFDCEWRSLREPLDTASRAHVIAETLIDVMPDRPIQIIDLGTGTGANLRYLSQILGGPQEWCLIDRDQTLLDSISAILSEWVLGFEGEVKRSGTELIVTRHDFECHVRTEQRNLATDLAAVDFSADALVSGSALLDLVSEQWLQELAQRCHAVRAPVLFALNYDGHMEFDPREADDERVRKLVNLHQMTDKGFGKALGPKAGQNAVRIFEQLGYRVEHARSDWRISPSDQEVQGILLDMWFSAALEVAPDEVSVLRNWIQRRRDHVACGRSGLSVGHIDLLGWLPR